MELGCTTARQELAAILVDAPEEDVDFISPVPGWSPCRGRCHDNADHWVRDRPGWKAVRGWLRADYLTLPNRARFLSHSVVEDPAGKLFEVTYGASDGSHRFIRHPGMEDEFLAAVRDNGMPYVEHSDRARSTGLGENAGRTRAQPCNGWVESVRLMDAEGLVGS